MYASVMAATSFMPLSEIMRACLNEDFKWDFLVMFSSPYIPWTSFSFSLMEINKIKGLGRIIFFMGY